MFLHDSVCLSLQITPSPAEFESPIRIQRAKQTSNQEQLLLPLYYHFNLNKRLHEQFDGILSLLGYEFQSLLD